MEDRVKAILQKVYGNSIYSYDEQTATVATLIALQEASDEEFNGWISDDSPKGMLDASDRFIKRYNLEQ